MTNDGMLTLHCPQCKQICDVVAEGNNLVCLECGYKFDEKVVAKFLGGSQPKQPAPASNR